MNFVTCLRQHATNFSYRDALIEGETRFTFGQWKQTSERFAGHLQTKEVREGDRVILLMLNGTNFAITYLGVLAMGGVPVPINARSTASDLEYILQDTQAKSLIVDERLLPIVSDAKIPDRVYKIKSGLAQTGWNSLYDILQEPVQLRHVHINSHQEATVLYTSGTTGRPKGIRFSYEALQTTAAMFALEFQFTNTSRLLHLMPLSHSAPLNLVFHAGLLTGSTHVFAPTFTPELLLQLTAKEKTTHFFGAPIAYLAAMQHPEFSSYDLSSAKYWIYGGAPLSGGMANQVGSVFSLDKLVCVYGLSEAGPSGSLLRHSEFPDKAGSIGKRAPLFTEIELVRNDGELCSSGEVGEIRLRGAGCMLGYLQRPEETEETMRDGWIYTGDLARRDDDGFYWMVDRKKDMIISGGVNIYPKEVETVLEQHPDIQEIAVVGVPHEQWGETVKACIVPKEGSNVPTEEAWLKEMKAFLSGKVADYKVPRLVDVLDVLPRNASGKLLKHLLREVPQA
ncbi:class I adenylate-forming enzyme family protein [Bacillus fonticola]|uniref:class I adenylate-forming enzyme family protein n=1 Tax=Bacillus fonticola TaxID=2728853 RepID=UPI00147563A2|nr:AMP-binding protein [Bacillus fonticola]